MENKNLKNKKNKQTIGWRPDQLLPRVGGGRRVGTGIDIRGLFGGDVERNRPLPHLWLWIQDSTHLSKLKKLYAKKSVFTLRI